MWVTMSKHQKIKILWCFAYTLLRDMYALNLNTYQDISTLEMSRDVFTVYEWAMYRYFNFILND